MQDSTRPRATNQLPLTRNHLYAMGALSLALALLAFFVGFSLGRGKAAAPPPVSAESRFLSEEARTGNLEVLLSKVEQARGVEEAMAFPSELPKSDPPPAPVDPNAPPPTEPVEPPPPPPNPFPPEARPGGAQLTTAPVATPTVGEDVPTSGWAVEVAEHAVEDDAARNVETLRAAGLSAYRVVAIVGGRTVWRVRVGGYGGKEAATAAMPAVASKAGVTDVKVTPAP